MTAPLSAQHALAIAANCTIPLVVTDRQGRVISYNPAFERLVGESQAGGLLGRAYAELGDHPARDLLGPETSISWADSNARTRHFAVQDIDLPDLEFTQARLLVDVSRQVELERAQAALDEELRQHILTDRVTGLLNRRGLVLSLEPQVARSRRYNSPIAVMMLELPDKARNDGARLQVARLLKDQLRWADLVGCNEQLQFILILPETTAEAALQLVDKLTRRLQDMFEGQLGGHPFLCHYGIAGWRRNDSAQSLLVRAAEALSQARSEQAPRAVAL
jgi:diguanylate cyclase (GGDEF)-like protein